MPLDQESNLECKSRPQQDKETGKKKAASPDLDSEGFPREDGVLVIFAGQESKRVEKIRFRDVNSAAPSTPSFMKWADTPITFDQSHHPPRIPHPGRHALIVTLWWKLVMVTID